MGRKMPGVRNALPGLQGCSKSGKGLEGAAIRVMGQMCTEGGTQGNPAPKDFGPLIERGIEPAKHIL